LTTKLRLLLDECLEGPLAAQIAKYSALNVEYINETFLSNRGTSDRAVVDYARQSRRIVVTPETRLNEHQFSICTHPGILVLISRNQSLRTKMFSDLMRSGVRARCQHAVTYLRINDHARTVVLFKERDESGIVRETTLELGDMPIGTAKPPFSKPKCNL
jgi:predicted nuclease of predicted toxin-antitoxin system